MINYKHPLVYIDIFGSRYIQVILVQVTEHETINALMNINDSFEYISIGNGVTDYTS